MHAKYVLASLSMLMSPTSYLSCLAIDVWSAGIILLCFLTRRFPFFNSNDDIEALAEIVAIFGSKKMERCATLHSQWRQSLEVLLWEFRELTCVD